MATNPIPLDRVRLGRLTIAPRSCLLHPEPGTRPGLERCPWWVYLSGPRLPDSIVAGPEPVDFCGTTPRGRELGGGVRIVERFDDAYGTRLVLAGLAPLAGMVPA